MKSPIANPRDQWTSTPELASRLRGITPARVGLRRAGSSLATSELLDFQLAHACARDAVHAKLEPSSLLAALRNLIGIDALLLHSAAPDRQTYLQRPDLGRKLDEASRQRLQRLQHPPQRYDLSLIAVDGLSALAVERHAVALLAELLPRLAQASPELRLAPVCVVEQGRVAIGDDVAQSLHAALTVVLIGERPGLSSPDSLGAYITWQRELDGAPGGIRDAERNCISNIRVEGLSYSDAAARLLFYIQEATYRQLTGVAIKDPELQLEAGRQ
jgi:ethanolamine ammonia-lyase small subunit